MVLVLVVLLSGVESGCVMFVRCVQITCVWNLNGECGRTGGILIVADGCRSYELPDKPYDVRQVLGDIREGG